MHPAIVLSEVTPGQRLRGRLQLILILAVVIGPMLLASAMYQWRFWVPQTRSYHGELIGTGRPARNSAWSVPMNRAGSCW